jgi:beta-glucanase (GH16 family)
MKLLAIVFLFFSINTFAQKRKLIWSDEFNYVGLPNKKKWTFEKGHQRNREQQYYTVNKKENAWVKNGCLTITGRKATIKNEQYKPNSSAWETKDSLAYYTSASVTTLGKAAWKYGRIEIRAKLPNGKGIWPAIWMMGNNRNLVQWPTCGEIDIMEFVGTDTNHVHSAVHYEQNTVDGFASATNKIFVQQPYEQFNIYALEWTTEKLSFYFNDSLYHSFNINKANYKNTNPFKKPFYLIINLAMGANWPGPIDDDALPQSFVIDYVRVYQ